MSLASLAFLNTKDRLNTNLVMDICLLLTHSLDVTISCDLCWHQHVHNISSNATRVLNFVHISRRLLSRIETVDVSIGLGTYCLRPIPAATANMPMYSQYFEISHFGHCPTSRTTLIYGQYLLPFSSYSISNSQCTQMSAQGHAT